MKKKLKKIIPLILALSLVLGMIPAAALADDSTEVTASGTQGDDITWVLTSDGTLTISGTGDIGFYIYGNSSNYPQWYYVYYYTWNSYRDEITSVVITNGITSFGSYAFRACSSLTSITIPDSVTSIGYGAFRDCTSLTDVYYAGSEDEWAEISIGDYNTYLTSATIHYNSTGPDDDEDYVDEGGEMSGTCGDALIWSFNSDTGMLTISGEGAMDDWDALTLEEVPWYEYLDQIISINVKDGVTSIGQCAFNDCENLEFVLLPSSLESIGAYAFNCYSEVFTDVYYTGSSAEWLVFTDEENANISEIGNDELLNAVIHYSCIGKLGLETDIWSFTNYDTFFFNDGYYITYSDALTLVSNLSEVDKNLVLIEDYWDSSDIITNLFGDNFSWYCRLYIDDVNITSDFAETWHGSCYGMAAWVVLNAAGTLDATDIDSTESYLADYISSSLLHDSYNLQSDAVQSAINFYYVQQYMTAVSELIDEFMSYTQMEQLSLLETLAEEAQEGGNPVIIHFQYYKLYESDGITCDTSDCSGHSIVAYGTEDGDYTDAVKNYWRIYTYDDTEGGYIYVDGYDDDVNPISTAEFTHRILIYDPNHINDDGQFYLYYSDDGVWCIPGYGIISTESSSKDTIYNNGQLKLVTADTKAINLVVYNTGELSNIASGNEDAVSYITSLFTNDYSVSWSGGSADISGFSVYNNTSDETINIAVEENITSDGESTSASTTAFLPESDEYTVTYEDEEAFFYLNTGNYLTMAAATSSGSITFRNDGGAAVTADEEAAVYISITANDGYTTLDWYRFEVLVEETTDISAELTDEGILISGGDLTNVIINGISDDEDACITAEFSTDEDTALVTTGEDDELVILVDADDDGTFETSIDYELYDGDDSSGTTDSEDDSSDEETEEETEPETEEETEPESESETEEETKESSGNDNSDDDGSTGDADTDDKSSDNEGSGDADIGSGENDSTDSETSAEETAASPESAATGDSNSLLFWFAVGVLALALLVSAATRRKFNR